MIDKIFENGEWKFVQKTPVLKSEGADIAQIKSPAMTWVKCADRLPEKSGRYLAVVRGIARIGYFDIRAMGEWFVTDVVDRRPTHWAPLPEPPEDAR